MSAYAFQWIGLAAMVVLLSIIGAARLAKLDERTEIP